MRKRTKQRLGVAGTVIVLIVIVAHVAMVDLPAYNFDKYLEETRGVVELYPDVDNGWRKGIDITPQPVELVKLPSATKFGWRGSETTIERGKIVVKESKTKGDLVTIPEGVYAKIAQFGSESYIVILSDKSSEKTESGTLNKPERDPVDPEDYGSEHYVQPDPPHSEDYDGEHYVQPDPPHSDDKN